MGNIRGERPALELNDDGRRRAGLRRVGRKLVGKSNDWRELDETGNPAKTLSTEDRHSETVEIEENQGGRGRGIQVVCTCIPPCIVGADGCFRGCPTEEMRPQT